MPILTLSFLTIINLLNYLDRYLVAALLPIISAELALSKEQGGQLVAAFVFGYVIFSPLFGYLGDRVNRVKLMAVGVGLWSLATVASGLSTSLLTFFIFRVAVGIGEASFGTICPGYIRDKDSEPVSLNRTLSIFFCAIPVGAALGYVIGGALEQAFNWRTAFFICGIPGLLLALCLLRLPEVKRTAPATKMDLLQGVRTILGVPLLCLAIIGYIFNSFALNGVAAFVTTYGTEIGFSLQAITTQFGIILVVTGLIGTFAGGRIASALADRSSYPLSAMLIFCAVTAALAVPFFAVAFSVQDRALFLLLCFIAEILVFASVAPINSVLVSAAPTGLVTLTQGVTIFLINLLGALLAPICIGMIADVTNLSFAMQLASLALVISAAVWWQSAKKAQLATVSKNGRCIVVMGVSGVGKSVVGTALVQRLQGWQLSDADKLHTPSSWQKITSGTALSDQERSQFVSNVVADTYAKTGNGKNVVLCWSALKEEHRQALCARLPRAVFLHLVISQELSHQRSSERWQTGMQQPHPGIIPNQFKSLEVPTYAISLDATNSLQTLCTQAIEKLIEIQVIEPFELKAKPSTT